MPQCHAFQILHGYKRTPVLFVNFVDGANVGMIQCGGSFGFTLEAAQGLWVFGYVVGQELKGNRTAELHVLGPVNHAHAAAAQSLDNAVMRNSLADHAGEMLGLEVRQVNEGLEIDSVSTDQLA